MGRTSGSTSSTEAPGGAIALGAIVGAHGLRGQVRVRYFGDEPHNLLRLGRVELGARVGDPEARSFEVARVESGRRREVRMELVGIESREAAEGLKGRLVLADPAAFEELPEGECYAYQLVGCEVVSEAGRSIGTVRGIWSTGALDLLVIEGAEGAEHLIPAGPELLREVDLEGRRIVVEVIPGLLDSA